VSLPKYLRRSLGLSQTAIVLAVALSIGVGMGVLQLGYELEQEQTKAQDLNSLLLTLSEGGAANAAWNLDQSLASGVVTSITASEGVRTAIITTEQGKVLAQASNKLEQSASWLSSLADYLFKDVCYGQRMLYHGDDTDAVGQLSIQLSSRYITAGFLKFALNSLIITLVQALLLGLMLIYIFYQLLTRPLQNLAQAIAGVNPERPETTSLPLSKFHTDNELGQLVNYANDMLQRLTNAQQDLRNLATRDTLTGLPNRRLITETLDLAIKRAHRHNSRFAVMFLDLDRFKHINDLRGHAYGDELLIRVANVLRQVVRGSDITGRLGGDEFLIILDDVLNEENAVVAAEHLLEELAVPLTIRGEETRITTSIGIAVYPDDGRDVGSLMQCADLAMYAAKNSGGDCWHLFSPEMSKYVEQRMQLEKELETALEQEEFILFYQPKLNCRDSTLAGCEALIRWRRNGEIISPDEFLPCTEETGLIIRLGDWVLEQACRQIAQWSKQATPISVAVNVSAKQLASGDYAQRLLDTLARHDVDPGLLEIEITETVLIHDMDRNKRILSRIRDHGVKVSIDDFGTGYSSLLYLNQLPISTLKIDQGFISGPERSKVIVIAVINLARTLGLATIAEGIETEEQRDWLIEVGCDVVQGYLFGYPVPADEFENQYFNKIRG